MLRRLQSTESTYLWNASRLHNACKWNGSKDSSTTFYCFNIRNNFVHKGLTEYKKRLSIGKNKYHNFKKPNNSGLAIKAESQAERNPEKSFTQSRGAEKGKVRTRDYICPHWS
jgi:hypothetical protein